MTQWLHSSGLDLPVALARYAVPATAKMLDAVLAG